MVNLKQKMNDPAVVTGPTQPGYTACSVFSPPNYVEECSTSSQPVKPQKTKDVSINVQNREAIVLPDTFGSSFQTTEIRHRFIRKVYAIVTLELLVTFAVVALFSTYSPVKLFVQRNIWTTITAYCVFMVTYITLVCCGEVRRRWPTNIIILIVFTLAMSYILGAVSAYYETEVVFVAIGVTAVLCFLITMFAVQTKHDFTGCGIYFYVAFCLLFIFGVLAIVMQNKIMSVLYSGGIALLFSFYLVYDTQCIIGRGKLKLSEEEHIFGALLLYYDVVMIFLAILGLSKD